MEWYFLFFSFPICVNSPLDTLFSTFRQIFGPWCDQILKNNSLKQGAKFSIKAATSSEVSDERALAKNSRPPIFYGTLGGCARLALVRFFNNSIAIIIINKHQIIKPMTHQNPWLDGSRKYSYVSCCDL